MAYIRTVKTSSGASAVQIVYSSHRGSRKIEHIGSGHGQAEVGALKAAARQRLAAGQGELIWARIPARRLQLRPAASGGPLEIVSTRMGHLWDALCRAYEAVGVR